MNTRQRGAEAERRARRFYRLRGYRILDMNAWAGGNELDGPRFGDPAEMVTAEKQRRLRRAAAAWLGAHPQLRGLAVRFDVVAVSPAGLRRISDAF